MARPLRDRVLSITAAYTATALDQVLLCNPTGGSFTLSLPTAVGLRGRSYFIKNTATSGSNTATVDPSGAQTIDGAASVVLSPGQAIWIVSDDANWFIVAQRGLLSTDDLTIDDLIADTGTFNQINVDEIQSFNGGSTIIRLSNELLEILTGGIELGPALEAFILPQDVTVTGDSSALGSTDGAHQRLATTADRTLTSTPQITAGTQVGQLLILSALDTETERVRFQDEDVLANSGVRLGFAYRDVTAKKVLGLMWDGDTWVELFYFGDGAFTAQTGLFYETLSVSAEGIGQSTVASISDTADSGSLLDLDRYRGTRASLANVQAGDTLARVRMRGLDSTAQTYLQVLGRVSDGDQDAGELLIYARSAAGALTLVATFDVTNGLSLVGNLLLTGSIQEAIQSRGVLIEAISTAAPVLSLRSTESGSRITETHFQERVTTTDATPTLLAAITIAAETTVHVRARIVAIRTGGAAGAAFDSASYERVFTVSREADTTTAIVGSVTSVHTAEDQAGWDVTIAAIPGGFDIQVTGAANNNITWKSMISLLTTSDT